MTKKKENEFGDLGLSELKAKEADMRKELVAFRVSMDISSIKSASNLQTLSKKLRVLSRFRSQLNENKK